MAFIKFHQPKTNDHYAQTFDHMMKDFCKSPAYAQAHERQISPLSDIFETEEGFVLHLAIPGVKKEEITLKVEGDQLTVAAERKFEKQEGVKYHKVRTQFGKFFSTFNLPENVDSDQIDAKYADGILTLSLPKKEEEKVEPKNIEVK